jgi:predicted PurR-regulated permease PerM
MGDVMLWVLGIHTPLFRGVGMALLSLLQAGRDAGHPAPAAVYLVLSGAVWRGITLIAFAGLVIGLIDTALRPMLVSKDTRMPDCLAPISTLGGLGSSGFNGSSLAACLAALFIAAWSMFVASRRAARVPGPSEAPLAAKLPHPLALGVAAVSRDGFTTSSVS